MRTAPSRRCSRRAGRDTSRQSPGRQRQCTAVRRVRRRLHWCCPRRSESTAGGAADVIQGRGSGIPAAGRSQYSLPSQGAGLAEKAREGRRCLEHQESDSRLGSRHATVVHPANRKAEKRLDEILDSLKYRTSNRISVKEWHKVLGELRSMSLAVPGSRGLFGILQEALRHKQKGRIRLTQAVDDLLEDFRWVVQDLTARPTHLYELFPDRRYACEACKAGMGGVWYPYGAVDPLVWRVPFPSDVQRRVVTTENPQGCITNSDLELAASILHLDVATSNFAERLHIIAVLSDNSPTVHWQRKGSTTTTRATSYLLRVQVLHQRHFAYHATFDHIPGAANVMADFASQAWDLSDDAFAVAFSSSYPQPGSWTHSTPRSEMISALISALLSKRPAPESFLPLEPRSAVGSDAGRSFSAVSALSTCQIPFSIRTYNSLTNSTTRASRSFLCSSPGSAVDASLAVSQRELHR
jgi:hypothetical protein